MTTTSAVADRHATLGTRSSEWLGLRTFTAASIAIITAAALAGCGSSGILGPSDVQTQAAAPASAPAQPAPVSQSRVALAPVMGAPEAVSKQVGGQLESGLQRQRVSMAGGGDKGDYTLRGYMVATKERTGTKISYIFDLTDGSGKRVNRFQGEEIAQGGDAKDPWSALTPEVSQRIADKTASSLATALASLSPAGAGSAGASPPVGVGASRVTTGSTTPNATPVAAANPGASDRGPAGSTAAATMVPSVTGAPGDGNDALGAAMRQEMQQAGFAAAAAGQRAYTVAGKVTMGPVKDGKQPIKIDWRVTDPGGALLATVTQNNEIQAGALDGPWGNIASDAAQGAAARIKQLIDENQAGGGAKPRSASAARSRT